MTQQAQEQWSQTFRRIGHQIAIRESRARMASRLREAQSTMYADMAKLAGVAGTCGLLYCLIG